MAVAHALARSAPIAERLLDNPYAQENLREGAENLKAAYRRASKRRVKPVEDSKVRKQVRQAVLSIAEAGKALEAGRQKPQRRRGRRLLVVLGLGAVAAVATNEELLSKLKALVSDGAAGSGGEA